MPYFSLQVQILHLYLGLLLLAMLIQKPGHNSIAAIAILLTLPLLAKVQQSSYIK
jgi:hypothetical protein